MKTTMTKVSLAISAAVLAVGGIAYAQLPEGREHMDTDGDGVVTKAEAQAAAPAMFARLDANKDGKLDKSDRDAHRAEMLGNRFAMLDTDKNGSISRDEFMAERGREARGKHDHDGPGKGGMGGHRGMRGGGMMMKMADANNDGAVSQAEFTSAAGKHFDMVDADKDGRITKQERQAAHDKMKAQWQARKADKSGAAN